MTEYTLVRYRSEIWRFYGSTASFYILTDLDGDNAIPVDKDNLWPDAIVGKMFIPDTAS